MASHSNLYGVSTPYAAASRRPRPIVFAVTILANVALFYALAMALKPEIIQQPARTVTALINVDEPPPIEEPLPPPPPPPPEAESSDEGAQGTPGRVAVAKAETAPKPKIPLAKPDPKPERPGRGNDNRSGAADSGSGTGAAGQGQGTGSGNSGTGSGAGRGAGRGAGVAVTKPIKIAGDINASRDFPIPPGGRQARWGKSVTVAMTVGTDGRASNCRIVNSSVDAEAGRIVCQLAVQRFRFRPAQDASGNPVSATYGWRQSWNPR